MGWLSVVTLAILCILVVQTCYGARGDKNGKLARQNGQQNKNKGNTLWPTQTGGGLKTQNEIRRWNVEDGKPNKKQNKERNAAMKKEWIEHKHAEKMTRNEERKMKQEASRIIKKIKQKHGRSARQTPSPVVRKEIRQLTASEMTAFANAVQAMITSGDFHTLVAMHSSVTAPGAHFGPAFLTWHRFFLRLFEIELQSHSGNASMALPFWNSTYEHTVGSYRWDDFSDSSLFSSDMLGHRNAQGRVVDGLFANMELANACKNESLGLTHVTRDFRAEARNLYSSATIAPFMSYTQHTDFSDPFNSEFEDAHAQVHSAIGGTMGDLGCSPQEILFWLHHCFVDLLWELNRATRSNAATDYPTDDAILAMVQTQNGQGGGMASRINMTYQFGSSEMQPFSSENATLTNIDGLSDDYKSMYTYEAYYGDDCVASNTPTGCGIHHWCDPWSSKCTAKIRPGLWMFWDMEGNPIQECVHCPGGGTPTSAWDNNIQWFVGSCA